VGLLHDDHHLRPVAHLGICSGNAQKVKVMPVVILDEVLFKKLASGRWLRFRFKKNEITDYTADVTDKNMIRELKELTDDGWSLEYQGVTDIKGIRLRRINA
jgi:hypothetical protein